MLNIFFCCSSLNSLIIGSGVTAIGLYTFSNCDRLRSVVIGSRVTSIDRTAFANTNLKKTIWLTNTPPAGAEFASGLINYVSNEQYSVNNKKVYPFLSSYFDVEGIRYVPVSPSERICDAIDCTYDKSLDNIIIPSSVTYQGISLNVKKVQPYCFSGYSTLKTISLGKDIACIEDYVFQDCSSLQSIIIPENITSINNNVFDGCTELKEFIIEDRDDELSIGYKGSKYNNNVALFSDCPLDSIYIGGNISYNTQPQYGYSPFYRNSTLRKVVITDKETEISTNEFYGCTNLQEFIIGDGVTSFGDWAFSGCSSLKSLSFGMQLKTIGKEAFSDCVSVTEITSKAVMPPECGSQALDDINKWNCKLYVPQGCIAPYQSADQWKEFFFIETGMTNIEACPEIIRVCGNVLSITGAPEGEEISIYNLSGQIVGSARAMSKSTDIITSLQAGEVGIVKIGNNAVKVMVK